MLSKTVDLDGEICGECDNGNPRGCNKQRKAPNCQKGLSTYEVQDEGERSADPRKNKDTDRGAMSGVI